MDFQQYSVEFNQVWRFLQDNRPADSVDRLADLRGYPSSSELLPYLDDVLRAPFVPKSLSDQLVGSVSPELGLFDSDKWGNTYSVIADRFVVPVRDILGNVLALVGYFPDRRKYMTTKSQYFQREKLFLGLDQIRHGALTSSVIVEGIFDALSLQSIGVHAFSTMGVGVSPYKRGLYQAMGTIVAIPDADSAGREVVQYDRWQLPTTGRYLTWKSRRLPEELGGFSIKDIDMLVRLVDPEQIRELIAMDHPGRVQFI